ncbi:MAG TPA: hypothetical protein VJY42_01500 [Candidatus Methanomethylophilaceae archaeon]|nr:hypothetical protein [Candidatus Methanomethylophilaceae archaeon]
MSETITQTTFGTDLKTGSWGKGILAAVVSLLFIVVIPLVLVTYLESYIQEFITSMGADMDLESIFDTFGETIRNFAIYGIPIVILAFFTGFYAKGNKGKLLFTLITLVYSIIWLFFIFEGGAMSMSMDFSSMMSGGDISIGNVDIMISFMGIILIMIGLILINMVRAYATYRSRREKYLKKYQEKLEKHGN